ncbi:PREDICTED: uncharacterized protein LOC109339983 [Lupinus angustifolius]|uniref:uncharacterized protein LOC109339983 n=1 Tax=Lupinus angustifolius TaxID=3871 RepID=UPI00092EA283|nr:PREDICTED: uncharacterized protein LOC109339983 [Lupinus angustifolius]
MLPVRPFSPWKDVVLGDALRAEPVRRKCVVGGFGSRINFDPLSLSVLAVTFSVRARRSGSGGTMCFHLLACHWHCGEWSVWYLRVCLTGGRVSGNWDVSAVWLHDHGHRTFSTQPFPCSPCVISAPAFDSGSCVAYPLSGIHAPLMTRSTQTPSRGHWRIRK